MITFEPDFSTVHASTPIWKKGTYEITVSKVRGRAWDKTDEKTQEKTMVRGVEIRLKLVGVYDSAGKLSTSMDGAEIAGKDVEPQTLYIHSDGAMAFSKRIMMAILGYKKEEEEEFNEYFKTLDLKMGIEEADGGGYDVTIGEGWQTLAGKNVIVTLSEGEREDKTTKQKLPTQEFGVWLPTGSVGKKK